MTFLIQTDSCFVHSTLKLDQIVSVPVIHGFKVEESLGDQHIAATERLELTNLLQQPIDSYCDDFKDEILKYNSRSCNDAVEQIQF